MKKKHSNGPRGAQSLFFCHLHEIRQLINSGNGYAYIFDALFQVDEKIRLRYLHDKKRGVQSLGRFFERKNSKEAKLSTQVIEKKPAEENTRTEQPVVVKRIEEDKTLEPLTSSSTSIWDIGDMKVVRETEEELRLREERRIKFERAAELRERLKKEKEEILKNQKKESS